MSIAKLGGSTILVAVGVLFTGSLGNVDGMLLPEAPVGRRRGPCVTFRRLKSVAGTRLRLGASEVEGGKSDETPQFERPELIPPFLMEALRLNDFPEV